MFNCHFIPEITTTLRPDSRYRNVVGSRYQTYNYMITELAGPVRHLDCFLMEVKSYELKSRFLFIKIYFVKVIGAGVYLFLHPESGSYL